MLHIQRARQRHYHRCRVEHKSVKSLTRPQTAVIFLGNYNEQSGSPFMCNRLNVVMTTLPHAVFARYPEFVSQIRNPNFVQFLSVQVHHRIDPFQPYNQLLCSVCTQHPSAIVLDMVQKQLLCAQISGSPCRFVYYDRAARNETDS